MKSCELSIEFTMEADSNSLKKTKQNMRVGRNGSTTSLHLYRNRYQQILDSKIQNSEESVETKEFENSFFETTKQYDFKETKDIKEENCNPWNVKSLFEFRHFCCPECDFITSNNISKNNCRQDFVDHVSTNHPWAISYLQNISDKSVKNITLCTKIKEEPLETIVENYVGASEIKLEQSEELYDPLNVTSVHKEKKLLKCDVGSKNGNRQVRCFCKVYLSCTNTITNPLDFLSIYQKEKQVKKEYKLRCIICSMKFANRAQLEAGRTR